jgi:chromosome segregation ATPase
MKLFGRSESDPSDEFKVLKQLVEQLQRSVDLIDQDLKSDRYDIAELKLRQGRIDDQLQEMRRLWETQTASIKQSTSDTIRDEVKELKEEVTKSNEIPSNT